MKHPVTHQIAMLVMMLSSYTPIEMKMVILEICIATSIPWTSSAKGVYPVMKMIIYLTLTGMFANVRDGLTRDALEEIRFGKKDRIHLILKPSIKKFFSNEIDSNNVQQGADSAIHSIKDVQCSH